MHSFEFLVTISIILLSTKVFGILSNKVNMPQVLGALIAGLIFGPSFLNLLHSFEFLDQIAELGLILLMFLAGIETDSKEIKKNGLASVLIAILGIILPLLGGFITYFLFFKDIVNFDFILKAIFFGIILTATSVSITVETLREMGKLKGKLGTTILGAAIIDDVIGIILLTLITGLKDSSVNIFNTFFNIALFFIFVLIIGLLIYFVKKNTKNKKVLKDKRRYAIYALAFCLLMAFLAESFFGITDITGAYFAGILISNLGFKKYIEQKISTLSYMIFSPIFFANIGIKTDIYGMNFKLLVFVLILTIVAILTKFFGCYLGARICKFNKKDSSCIGIGMASRGEVALIIVQKGLILGFVEPYLFPAVILVVIITTLLTPILLKKTLNT